MDNVKGIPQLQKRLTMAGLQDGRVGPRMLKRWQIRTVQLAKTNAPKVSGHLKQGIHPGAISSTRAQVESSAAYSGPVELGARPHIIRPVKGSWLAWGGERRLSGSLRTGAKPTVFARIVHHPGNKPQPFLLPAGAKAMEDSGMLAEVVLGWNSGA